MTAPAVGAFAYDTDAFWDEMFEAPDRVRPHYAALTHALLQSAVLRWLRRIGGHSGRVVVVGCEPASLDEAMGLSEPVAASVSGAVKMIRSLVAELRAGSGELIAES